MVLDSFGQLHRVADSRSKCTASEVQGECRGKLAWPLLSRRRWSPLHLDCNGKGTKKIDKIQVFSKFVFKKFEMLKSGLASQLGE